MAKPPDAFLSYTRFDDHHDRGAISKFRVRLANAVRAVTGEAFEIFQDVDGIGLGEKWPGKLDQILDEARFFIPIITPNFFSSKACRDELEKFLKAEKDRGWNDLVLPIYYIHCRVLEDPSLREKDPLASVIHERQLENWQERRFKDLEDPELRRSLETLAYKIDDARRRVMEEERKRAEAERRAKEEEARQRAEKAARSRAVEEQRRRAMEAEAKRRAEQDRHNRAEQQAAKRHAEEGERRRAEEAEARHREEEARRKLAQNALEPGPVFRDIEAPWCPEMVVIPGKLMRHYEDFHIAYRFAVGRYPVTFGEYDDFCEALGREKPDDESWGRGRRPVIDVSWDDAKAYVAWLGEETGKPYRLLSETEWEYACRAGTTTRYWWGDKITSKNANYGGNVGKTTEVDAYLPNPWGLYDMHGNVGEWVEGSWSDDNDDCSRQVRGGSWADEPGRSADRDYWFTDVRDRRIGFRVARTLSRSERSES